MQTEPLTLAALLVRTMAVGRQKAPVLLGWGLVAILLCLPCTILFLQLVNFVGDRPFDPISSWGSLTPVEKLGCVLSMWFISLGVLGLTQAIAALATWDADREQPTNLGNLTSRLLPKLHRILGLQLFIILMIIVLLPLSVFAPPAILIDNCGVFRGIGRSTDMWSHHAGKTILILLSALVVAIGWRLALGPVTLQGPSSFILALALEARLGMFYLMGVLIGIPTTLLYCQSRHSLQPPAQQ